MPYLCETANKKKRELKRMRSFLAQTLKCLLFQTLAKTRRHILTQ